MPMDQNSESSEEKTLTGNSKSTTKEEKQNDEIIKLLLISERQYLINRIQFYTGVFLNAVMVAATVVLAVYTEKLSVATNSLKLSSVEQVRPYVFPDSISNQPDPYIVIKNLGLTPAYKIVIDGEAFIEPISGILSGDKQYGVPPIDMDCKYVDNVGDQATNYNLGASQTLHKVYLSKVSDPKVNEDTWTFNQINDFSDEQIASWNKGDSIYIVMGVVCYGDLSGKRYYTKYCKAFPKSSFFNKNGQYEQSMISNGTDCFDHNDAE